MKAAVIHELGTAPTFGEVDAPPGDDVLEVLAAPINPLDLAVSRGGSFAGDPPLPYVPGSEAVGRRADGRVVWISGGGLGSLRDGGMAEQVATGKAIAVDVPEGVDPALAAGLGIAGLAGWLPLAWRAPVEQGDSVLVLGATGSVGTVAVQAARLLGAARVVAAGRDAAELERARARGADAVVRLDEGDLVAAFRDACGGDGPTYVFDPLWGEPLAAAAAAAAPHARIVNLGQSAGATSPLTSAAVRSKQLTLYGHTHFRVPPDVLGAHFRRLVDHASAGDVVLDVERVPLADVAEAWRRQAEGGADKLVLVP